MPAEQTTDYRPYGAAAGASLPTLGLLEYLLKTRPEILRKMKAAPDWSLANGDIDVARAVKELKPGDFGVSGLQSYPKRGPHANPMTNFLVYGSGITSGGPGAHGQVVGRNLQVEPSWLGLDTNAKTRDLPFLMNERGELYSPQYGKNYKKLHDIRDRFDQWEEYRKARAAGKPATRPPVPAPSRKELAFFRSTVTDDFASPGTAYAATGYGKYKERIRQRAQDILGLKQLERAGTITPEQIKQLEKLRTAQGKGVRGLRKFLSSPSLRAFFEQQPDAGRDANFDAIQRMADDMAGVPNPADTARKARLGELATAIKGRGGEKATQIAEMIDRATKQAPSSTPRSPSKVFKPKAFEQFIPTLHHGGLQGTAQDPMLHFLEHLSPSVRKSITSMTGIGLSDISARLAENKRELGADRRYVRKNPDAIYRPLFGRPDSAKVLKDGFNSTDTVFDATAMDGSRMRPAHMPGTAAYGPGGPRSTTWARWRGGVDDARLHEGLVKNVGKSYNTSGATAAGAKEILGLSSLRRMMGLDHSNWGQVCWGNHCGSMPSQIYKRTGNFRSPLPHQDILPNSFLAHPNVDIIGIANKSRALKDFAQLSRMRIAAGLGAAGLMGAAGYGATHMGQGAVGLIGSFAKPKPTYDPRLVEAVKAFLPKKPA